MEILNDEVREATKKKFDDNLEEPVTLVHFTQEPSRLILPDSLRGQECHFCKETKALLQEVCSLSDKLVLEIFDFTGNKTEVEEFGVDKIPVTIVTQGASKNFRFFGIPSGYEYASLVEAIVDVSKGTTSLDDKTKEALKSVEEPIHIQTFVTPTCPYCTTAVRLGPSVRRGMSPHHRGHGRGHGISPPGTEVPGCRGTADHHQRIRHHRGSGPGRDLLGTHPPNRKARPSRKNPVKQGGMESRE